MKISDWGGIQQNFAEDGSMKMMETMYEIMCGTFEKYDLMNELTWSKKLEKNALKHLLLKYMDQPEQKHGFCRKPGGIEIIIKAQRNKCNKLMNLKTKKHMVRKFN